MTLLVAGEIQAEINSLNGGNTKLRLRVGSNGNTTDTVIINVPDTNVGDGTPVVSTNNISGSSGQYTVRFLMDMRRYPGNNGPFPLSGTARLRSNSSNSMSCITAATCGSTQIPFTTISWTQRDGDMVTEASAYNGAPLQQLHSQVLGLGGAPGNGVRYRDYLQFSYDNATLLPAGSYRGTINFTGDYQ